MPVLGGGSWLAVAVLPDVLGAALAPTAPGRLLSGLRGRVAGQAGAGRAYSRCQQARNASFQGQVRLSRWLDPATDIWCGVFENGMKP